MRYRGSPIQGAPVSGYGILRVSLETFDGHHSGVSDHTAYQTDTITFFAPPPEKEREKYPFTPIDPFVTPECFVIFFHDCSLNASQQNESVELLRYVLNVLGGGRICTYVCVVMTKQDRILPVEIRESEVQRHAEVFEKVLEAYHATFKYEVLCLPGLDVPNGERIHEIIDAVNRVVVKKKSSGIPDGALVTPVMVRRMTNDELAKRALSANLAMGDADEFWKAFTQADLPSWDHHTHLRAGYAVLLESLSKGRSLLTCAGTFIAHLERLKSADPDKFKNTANKYVAMSGFKKLALSQSVKARS